MIATIANIMEKCHVKDAISSTLIISIQTNEVSYSKFFHPRWQKIFFHRDYWKQDIQYPETYLSMVKLHILTYLQNKIKLLVPEYIGLRMADVVSSTTTFMDLNKRAARYLSHPEKEQGIKNRNTQKCIDVIF